MSESEKCYTIDFTLDHEGDCARWQGYDCDCGSTETLSYIHEHIHEDYDHLKLPTTFRNRAEAKTAAAPLLDSLNAWGGSVDDHIEDIDTMIVTWDSDPEQSCSTKSFW